MKVKIAVIGIILGLAAIAQTSRTVWDGVYTDDQAKRGEGFYGKECASCHGSELTGGESAPPLAGDSFFANWNGLTLGDLFERIRVSMPQNAPGSLSRQQNADILAFILRVNQFPTGKTELDRQTDILKTIKFDSTKPKS
jgi:S-disulfanyl-L-cysteine oxidoreductase SoxD